LIVILDTSVLCALLKVPRRDQHHAQVVAQLRALTPPSALVLVPAGVLVETANHIAQCEGDRYRLGRALADLVAQALGPEDSRAGGLSPLSWSIVGLSEGELRGLLAGLPTELAAGRGLTDWSAIRLFELYHQRYPARRVWIWSFDQHLEGYDSHPM
jgi:hypothetical protein